MSRWTLFDLKNLPKHMVKDYTHQAKNRSIVIEEQNKKIKPFRNIQKQMKVSIRGNVPSKSNCYRIITLNGHGSLAKTKQMKSYEESFMWQCGSYRGLAIATPFEFHINVFYPSKRSDLDNSLKIVLDCLQKVKAITNDNNCCKIVAQKFIDKEQPRVEFEIIPV